MCRRSHCESIRRKWRGRRRRTDPVPCFAAGWMAKECINSAKLFYCSLFYLILHPIYIQIVGLRRYSRLIQYAGWILQYLYLHRTTFFFPQTTSNIFLFELLRVERIVPTSICHLFCVCDIVQIRFLPSFLLYFPLPLLSNGLPFRLTLPSPSPKLSCLSLSQLSNVTGASPISHNGVGFT